ncbi:MAG: cysteine desulfurase-like protein [Planctomycetaceae bacterium]
MSDVSDIRSQFPALLRTLNGRPVVYVDGPAGSQVPAAVAEAVSRYLLESNANHGGVFDTSQRSDAILHEAHCALADLLGAGDPDCIVFGANTTTIALAVSRALGRTWRPGDEVIVSDMDHEANVTPWMLAAKQAGAVIRRIAVHKDGSTLDLDDFRAKLSPRTRLVAVGYASNLTGTIHPVAEMTAAAHEVGADVFIDAVHFAPHGLIDVKQIGCEFLACSAYKFFGPHVGVLYGKRDRLESLEPDKLRVAPNDLPHKWMTGTQNHEGIAGAAAAVEYLAGIGRRIDSNATNRRSAIEAAFRWISTYERSLATHLIVGLQQLPGIRIWGITDPQRLHERVPTVSFTHAQRSPAEIATRLAERGIFVWAGSHYALPFTEAMHLEPLGTLRVGLMHYNTPEEVDRLLRELGEFL